MAIKGVNLSQLVEFVSEHDDEKGTEGEARFTFKILDGFQAAYLQDKLMGFEQLKEGSQSAKVNMGRVALETVQFALQSATNFLDPETNMPIELERTKKLIMGRSYSVIKDEVVAKFPSWLVQEMYVFLQDKNGLTADEAKKSA